jgi:hypothetical protein
MQGFSRPATRSKNRIAATPGFSIKKRWRRRSGSNVDAVVIEGLVMPFWGGGVAVRVFQRGAPEPSRAELGCPCQD